MLAEELTVTQGTSCVTMSPPPATSMKLAAETGSLLITAWKDSYFDLVKLVYLLLLPR